MISVSNLLDQIIPDRLGTGLLNEETYLHRSVEGIFYHKAMDLIHRLWHQKENWKFIATSILANWPKWLSDNQRMKLLIDIKRIYDILLFFKSNDIVLRTSSRICTQKYHGILDALIYRPYPDGDGEVIIREIKRSISMTDPIPFRYKLQLVLYSYGAEQLLEQPPPQILKGEIISINPPVIREVDLRILRQNFALESIERW